MFNENIDKTYDEYLKTQRSKRKELADVTTRSDIRADLFAAYCDMQGSKVNVSVQVHTGKVLCHELLVEDVVVKSTKTLPEMSGFLWNTCFGEIEDDLTSDEFEIRLRSIMESLQEGK